MIADDRAACGGRLILFPAHGVVAIESRLAPLLTGDESDHQLVAAEHLPAAAELARRALGDFVKSDLGEHVEVRRCDLAAELRFGTSAEGFAFLRDVASLSPPRAVRDVWRAADGQVMTIYARTPKRGVVIARAYDKGRESGSDPPGRRVRLEDQDWPPKSRRQRPDVVATSDLRHKFGRTMEAYVTQEQLTSAGPDGAVAELAARAIRGELSHARAERLIGSVALLKHGGRAVYDRDGSTVVENNKRSSRRLKALRDSGVVLADDLPPAAVVPTTELLREAIARFQA